MKSCTKILLSFLLLFSCVQQCAAAQTMSKQESFIMRHRGKLSAAATFIGLLIVWSLAEVTGIEFGRGKYADHGIIGISYPVIGTINQGFSSTIPFLGSLLSLSNSSQNEYIKVNISTILTEGMKAVQLNASKIV